MKLSYSVNNLRRLTSVPMIEVRPITILLGRNSVGKSTFLRSFPLLRQSIETRTSAPILWYGNYVDFGNFRSAVTDNDKNRSIDFSFEVDSFASQNKATNFLGIWQPVKGQALEYGHVKVVYSVRGQGETTERTATTVFLPGLGTTLRVDFHTGGIFGAGLMMNDQSIKAILEDGGGIYCPSDSLFENLVLFTRQKEGGLKAESRLNVFQRLIEREISPVVDSRIGRRRITTEAQRILEKAQLNQETINALLKRTETQAFRSFYSSLTVFRTALAERLDAICRTNYALNVLELLNSSLETYFKSVEYIGPARARSERFYRQQELEVSEISPDGRNLPMFLASLGDENLKHLSNWVQEIFGYGVSVHKTEGHISINLEQDGKSINVLDTGYGVSQVLPVLTQIWWMQRKDRVRGPRFEGDIFNSSTLVIEQPELHLHPAHQALLADVFVESVKAGSDPISFLIETHSESMINRLGELISIGMIAAEKVQIVIFGDPRKDADSLESPVQLSTFDQKGVLQNWPFGFFNY